MAQRLPAEEQPGVLGEPLSAARGIDVAWSRAAALAAVAQRFLGVYVDLLKGLDHMTRVQKSSFIWANFSRMTDWEKYHALQLWARFDPVTRTKLFDAMYPFCSDEQKTIMHEVASGASSGEMCRPCAEIEAKVKAFLDR